MTSDNSSARAPTSINNGAAISPDGSAAVAGGEVISHGQHHVEFLFEQAVSAGPLPSVRDFAGYDQVCPGAARDILDMAIAQQKHAHSLAKSDLWTGFTLKILGLVAAILLAGAMLFTAFQLAIHDKSAVATVVLAGTGLASVASLFLRQRFAVPVSPATTPARNEKSRQKKRK